MSELLVPNYLRAAVINQRIYPPGSPMVERSVSQIIQAVETALKSGEHLTYTSRQGKLFYKGKELPEGNTLTPYLDEHGIQSLTFTPGVTGAEVSQLVILLSRKKLPDGNVEAWLQQNKVAHVQVDKVKVVEVMEGEMVMKKVDQLFEGVRDFPGLLGSLRDSYDMIDKIPDETGRVKTQEHVARKLAGMDPGLLRDMFENPLPKRVEDSGLKDMVLNAMTQDKIHDIFTEIGTWYKQMREQTSSDFEVVEHLNKLKSFLGKLLTAPASKKVPFGLYEEMLTQGLIDKIPEGIEKKPEEESLASQVEDLLSKPGAALLEQPTRDQLPAIMKKLCDIGLDELSQKLLEKIIENYSQGATVVRQVAVRVSRHFLETLLANRKEKLWTLLSTAVEQLADEERNADVYKEVLEALSMAVMHFILNERPADAVQLLAQLRRHQAEPSPAMPKRQELAAKTLQQISDNAMEVLTEGLLSGDKDRKDACQNILAHLGEGAIPCFVRMIKRAPDLRQRRLAASALKYYGPAGKTKLAAEFHLGNGTDVLLNVLSVLDDFLSPDLVPRFEALMHYPDATVRRRLIQLLAKIQDAAAAKLLLSFLDDPDEGSQIDAIRAAGETKNRDAVAKLADLLRAGSTRRLEETCLALGQIGDGQAVPGLSEILEPKSSLFKRKTAVEETVRVRAAWALAQINTHESRELLSKMTKDPNLQVQTIARNALDS